MNNRLQATTVSIVSYINPVQVISSNGLNIFDFGAEVEREVHSPCEMALNMSLALRLSGLSFDFRSVSIGAPITRTDDTDFEVVEYIGTKQCEDFVTCETAATIFPALVRSQWPSSRPTVMVSKAKLIEYEGPQIVWGPAPMENCQSCIRIPHQTIMTSQHGRYTNIGAFIHSRNVGNRYIAGEL